MGFCWVAFTWVAAGAVLPRRTEVDAMLRDVEAVAAGFEGAVGGGGGGLASVCHEVAVCRTNSEAGVGAQTAASWVLPP